MSQGAGAGRAMVAIAVLTLGSCGVGTPSVGLADQRYETCPDPIASAAYSQAQALIAAGKTAQALPLLRDVVGRCPDFVDGHIAYQNVARAIGESGAGGGEVQTSMEDFYEALPDSAASPVLPYVKSRALVDDFDRLPLLDTAIERDRSFYYALVDKAKIQRRLGRTVEALDALQRAVSARPECADANLELAQVLSGLGRGAEARVYYEQYLECSGDDLEALREFIKLLIYADKPDLDRAEELSDRLFERDSEDAIAWMDRAAIAWRRGDVGAARDAYHHVLEIDPTRDRAALNLGNLYFQAIAGDSEPGRRTHWPKARAAYRYFLGLQRAEGASDLIDFHLSVPYRLDQIAALLGPPSDAPPTLSDF